MWLATTIGFFSATVSAEDPSKIQIRARERKDLETLKDVLGLGAEVLETPRADYRYRVIIEPEQFPRILEALAAMVDYSNFKDAVKANPDQAHKVHAYHRVWATMKQFQPVDAEAPGEFDLWGHSAAAIEHRNAPEGPLEGMSMMMGSPECRDRRPAVAKGAKVLSNPKARKKKQTGVCPECGGDHHFTDCPLR